jgi:cytochrome d ubiquinol oxidase subunit II
MDTLALLQNIWFVLVGVLLVGYSILDGFDLGLGSLFGLIAKTEDEKRRLFNAIWPVWDGNEVWLLTGGGALFAAFPLAYATVFSGFYLALMLVLFSLIFRAVAIEFWYYDQPRRKLWEAAFIIGSFLPSLLFGVALGNVILGIPLNDSGDFTGTFFTLLRPYPLAMGLAGCAALLLHGSIYAALKTDGEISRRAGALARTIAPLFLVLFGLLFAATAVYCRDFLHSLPAWLFSVIVISAAALIIKNLRRNTFGFLFTLSSVLLAGLWGIAAAVHYPNLVRSLDGTNTLTIYNASSSLLTLKVMLIIALIGMPLVIGYTIFAYRVFKGKAQP